MKSLTIISLRDFKVSLRATDMPTPDRCMIKIFIGGGAGLVDGEGVAVKGA